MITNHLDLLKNNYKFPQKYNIGTLCLHITDNCQLYCDYCTYKGKNTGSYLNNTLFEKLEIFQPLNVIVVGGGEPVFDKPGIELFQKVLCEINSNHIGLITNGIEYPLDNINTNKLKWVRISIDACSNETYYSIKKKYNFNDVLVNIKKYLQKNIQYVGLGFTINNKNIVEIPSLYSAR